MPGGRICGPRYARIRVKSLRRAAYWYTRVDASATIDPVPAPAHPTPEAANAARVRMAVGRWFKQTGRDLPWRSPTCTPWGILVSEVMAQQTPIARVEPAWRAWMERWPTPDALASASTAEVLRAWGSLGYPRRALRLQQCARVVVSTHDGVLPSEESDLLALPGVGTYTAAAIMAFAYGRRSIVVDTNVRRVLARAFLGIAQASPTGLAAQMAHAAAVVPEADDEAALWSAASMELGALVCTARVPACGDCPIADLCAWRAAGFPPDAHAPARRTQAWAGTDRQVRGRVMALLRESTEPVPRSRVDLTWPEPEQLARCLTTLLADGLIAAHDDGFALPH